MKRTILIAVLVMALVAGIAAYAYGEDTGDVVVNAAVNPRISLAMADTQADLVLFAPANETDSETLTLNVRSNVGYDVTLNDEGGDDLSALGFTMTDIDGVYAKAPSAGGFDHDIDFEVDVTGIDWPDAGTLTHTYTYSVVQN